MIWIVQISVFVTTWYLNCLPPYQSRSQHSWCNVAVMSFLCDVSIYNLPISLSLSVSLLLQRTRAKKLKICEGEQAEVMALEKTK